MFTYTRVKQSIFQETTLHTHFNMYIQILVFSFPHDTHTFSKRAAWITFNPFEM